MFSLVTVGDTSGNSLMKMASITPRTVFIKNNPVNNTTLSSNSTAIIMDCFIN